MTNPNNPGTYREMPYSPFSKDMTQQPMQGTPMQRNMPGTNPNMPPAMPPASQIPLGEQPPTTLYSPYYLAGYLKKYIGKTMRVEFLVGSTGPLTDRVGTLQEVGVSYIVLKQYPLNTTLICDLYSIKFVTVYP
jgi:hypothetical protein